ncbi:MAG: helix-turn-helix domain-containing protein [Acidimicrobiia bacterium]|nr:helix-turn-helix domain-containing protein [Acidimicrobiia bacterium]
MTPRDPLLTVQDLAAYLGVPATTIYAWRYRHEGPPGFRVGRYLRYQRSDVESWIAERLEQTGAVEKHPAAVRPRRRY